ncbi:P-type conjugative transfer protein VirB9 [Parashewanella curva]|uniref:P-type conjugative transfer protein VirB9 n=1 Tax=Parashewanella curva TaxID=2338552 RepID=A0A3L8PTQ4_9GAMM|nr:P-type conjugative transfer protein VirB9 [Parashewanella curva]RLV58199.1 P-type conjugative transfer protein VirB9 [Parashewanella curva]
MIKQREGIKVCYLLDLLRRTCEGRCLVPLSLNIDKSRWMPVFTGMALMLTSLTSLALETPHMGHFDKRVRHINFNPQQVVKLVGHYGFATDIAFASGESIKQIAMGDSGAWSVTPVDNHIFIKPKAQQATTNMTVLTNRHVYQFELNASLLKNTNQATSRNMMFAVDFIYPDDLKTQLHQHNQQQLLNDQLDIQTTPQVNNQNYFYKGDKALLPTTVFDDGRFTYLKFSQKQDLPAVYTVNSDNSESLVNSHINPDFPNTIVIRLLVRRLVLRQGQLVLCLFNQSFDAEKPASYQKTQIPQVKRTAKRHGGSHG